MIKDGFMYIAVLIFLAAILVNLPRIFKGRIAQNIFSFAPPVVLIYMGMMLLCTRKMCDLCETAEACSTRKIPGRDAMVF